MPATPVPTFRRLLHRIVVVFAAITLATTLGAQAQIETVIHNFTGLDGSGPGGGVIFDGAGNLYGTTGSSGSGCCGTVFQLTLTIEGWRETVLYNLSNTDGYLSMATLFLDSAGNLYGTTLEGGDLNYCGG